MIRLAREIRFALTPPVDRQIGNSWSGWPSTDQIVPQLKLTVTVAGTPDPETGYLCNIKSLDSLIRTVIVEDLLPDLLRVSTACRMLRRVLEACQLRAGPTIPVSRLELHLNPCLKYSLETEKPSMMRLTQQFEFSAAHRLHCNELSDQENRDLFGKCNNPEGHGHNYVVEVSVERDVSDDRPVVVLGEFESIVRRLVVDRLDHKNLNREVKPFDQTNPTVENIAIAIWHWLEGEFGNARLANVRVYETPKTFADCSR